MKIKYKKTKKYQAQLEFNRASTCFLFLQEDVKKNGMGGKK